MTATLPRPTGHRTPTAGQPADWATSHSATRRTLLALLATALGATPLKALLSDSSWLFQGWLTMLIVIGPAALIRVRRPAGALDIWPGIVLLIPWLTLVYVPHHAWGGLIPTGATMDDVSRLMDDLHRTTRDEIAPVHSTVAIRLVVCALLGLLAALIDLIAVVGRRGALAGVPLLVVFTVAGAVPRSPVAWGWFTLAAIGFLILLGLDAGDEMRDWGRRIARRGAASGRPNLAISAQRIGIAAVVVALTLPALVPDHSRNLLADAFHHGNGKGVGDFGAGTGGGATISPFIALKGQLDRNKAVKLMDVTVDGPARSVPFYLRTNVLDHYTNDVGWSVSGHGPTESIAGTSFATWPPNTPASTTQFSATITVAGLGGNVPVFSLPRSVQGVSDNTTWSPQDGILLGGGVHKGQQIRQDFAQPQPSLQELRNAPEADAGQMQRWLELPKLPSYVRDLVTRLTTGPQTPYDRARSLSDYFADPANGFVYSLKTEPGDSGSALVDFLKNKTGYCQQYAAALAVMFRAAGIPSRVVLGYMHGQPDRSGHFTVSTLDAHAWVEGYFAGVGWVPFDPTPTAGLSGGRASDLSWAPHVFPSNTPNDVRPRTSAPVRRPDGPSPTATGSSTAPAAAAHTDSSRGPVWLGLGVLGVLLVALVPFGVRSGRRRQRYLAARRGDADALWAELSDTAVDLGYVWSPARSPRQVSAWLARDAGPTAPALDALAAAVERRRYSSAATIDDAGGLVRSLHEVTGELRSRRSWRLRMRAALWPASLGWGRRLRLPRRH